MTTVDRQPPPRIVSLATAVPSHRITQTEAVEFFKRFFDVPPAQRKHLTNVYLNAEIDSRYTTAPVQWYEQLHDFEQKNDRYIDSAVSLLKKVAVESLAAANLECGDIDMIVTVSTTGIAVPALDARLMEELPFRRNVQRLPLFGLGCAGGVLGLARAATCARAQPGSRILYLVVELCGLTFCGSDRATANIIATALFGDGAAGAVLSTTEAGPAVAAWGEHTWPGSLDVMGWHVTRNGLEVRMSRSIPDIVRNLMRPATDEFLASIGLTLADIDDFVCHPGGAKVLEALENAFNLASGGLSAPRAILREFGNMSAVTVMFVLKRILATSESANGGGTADPKAGRARRYLMTALGPGFSIGFVVLESD